MEARASDRWASIKRRRRVHLQIAVNNGKSIQSNFFTRRFSARGSIMGSATAGEDEDDETKLPAFSTIGDSGIFLSSTGESIVARLGVRASLGEGEGMN